MGRACCILGCTSGGDVPSHHIPKNPALFLKWKSAIYSEKIEKMTDEQISKCAVCYRHFSADDYLVTFRVRKLKRDVAPSLNLPNRPATNNDKPNALETTETSDTSLNIRTEKKTTKSGVPEVESKTDDVALFEDLPDEAEFCFKQLQLNKNAKKQRVEKTNSTEDLLQYCQKRKLRRKQMKLSEQQLAYLRYKKQAEQYEKTPTIQKLLSFFTHDEIASVKTEIRKSKYSPKIYVKKYHKIAKQRALGQSKSNKQNKSDIVHNFLCKDNTIE